MAKMDLNDLSDEKFEFAIDRGGTFTDVWARCPGGKIVEMKLLSEDPSNYSDAPREGIRRILEQETGIEMPIDQPVESSIIEWIRMGTTVATNALLERKGERIALVVTKGFKDILHIGNQARPKIFDLEIVTPEVLYETVIEVEERVVLHNEKCELGKKCEKVQGTTGEQFEIWQPINIERLKEDLKVVYDMGIRSLAVVLMHAYSLGDHEREVGQLAKEMGFTQVSLSSDVMPMVRMVPRGYTACADAYLTPCINRYVTGFMSGFRDHLQGVRVLFMQSDGGLTPVGKFNGSRAILSGPAGGVVGYALTTYQRETESPVIGFDMGGTSTDVSRYAGHYEHVFETTTAGITIQAPQLDINTVAAGGGSMLFFRSGMFVVGPESAGAHPGPVCYKKGGPLTITDANLCLGRLLPDFFPKIFGDSENDPLDTKATVKAFTKLTKEVNKYLLSNPDNAHNKAMSIEEVAMGFLRVANEAMCRPIRALTEARGYDTSRHVLACFGGAGGQHACSIARSLGMKTVFVHRYAGILSAYGMALADVVHEAQEPCAATYGKDSSSRIDERIDELKKDCFQQLHEQGFKKDQIHLEPYLHLRYKGTDCALMCPGRGNPATGDSSKHGDFRASFLDRYQREFGFTIPERDIIVDDIRVRGVGSTGVLDQPDIPHATGEPVNKTKTKCYFEDGYLETSVYLLEELQAGHKIHGPAIIMNGNSTILIEPACEAVITRHGDVKIHIGDVKTDKVGPELNAIQLSIFSHRFMSIAEQMGRVLQRTAISTNIKERLDFSCAMFGPDGGLVANAPHIPVHLGAMQETVQYQIKTLGSDIHEGDVILSNHPCAGGSHLPDLTVITPVFFKGIEKPVFFVAARGHHADIGGDTPGSMPPHSTHIMQEGAVFKSFKLVEAGKFQEEALTEALMEPRKYPGCSGTRNLNDNISDLRAQVAACRKGIDLICGLIEEYGLDVVQAYMTHIQTNAEVAVRDMLKEIAAATKERTGTTRLQAEDFMDTGSNIRLSVEISEKEGSAVFDFTGTGHEIFGNTNAPRAITLSAIIYCLRCMVGHDVPLNQGCLNPIQIVIPKGCLLDPSNDAAVVGGNVETSQRVVDVILKAFAVCAASQGSMNNLTFGDGDSGYYETVAGGAGAGPGWHGRGGVHTHMTNTRITDPEILEKRYPVVLNCFSLNHGSGGRGKYSGGDGVMRELLFRKRLTLSILTERRVFRPYGLFGGEAGQRGLNLLIHADDRVVNLGSKCSVTVSAGDRFRLLTPGGGGYGDPDDDHLSDQEHDHDHKMFFKKRRADKGHHKYAEKGSVHAYKMKQESA